MPSSSLQILAVIPARGGSKGIPRKNIRPFAGKPLIAHTIEVARAAPSVSRVVVSTDDEEIAHVARTCGAEVPFLRPAALASDRSPIVDTVVHLLETLQVQEHYIPTHVLLLQPTNPLRTVTDIEAAVALLQHRGADAVVSVCRTENMLLTKAEDDRLVILNTDQLRHSNRQELPAYYRLDGCMIYLVDTQCFLAERRFFAGALVGYEIERWRAVDLDEPQDLVVGELLYQHQQEIAARIRAFPSV